ncbi:MAG: D-aminoacyl-tRNA deacylase [Candidatus Gastranaerophilales bacterium]|nr:D-aminoacyl-tRNA deacylase [Candidatus Gastranaerophilales bacterium]
MKTVIQRVKKASVTIENKIFSQINKGILVLLGIEKDDTEKEADFLVNKIANLRIFPDENGKMNLSIKDINGQILVVSQFTLTGNCKKGTRPSFDNSKEPIEANALYEKFIEKMKQEKIDVKTGKFAALMDVSLINDGPVTFILEKNL